jgi:hypothetical protein
VLLDGRVQVLRWFLCGCHRHGAQEDNAELKTPQVAQEEAQACEHARSVL